MTEPRLSLRWDEGGHKDRAELQRFICANPPKARYQQGRGKAHPAPWELEVQSSLRGLTPPTGPDERLLLGYTLENELAAAVWLGLDDHRLHFIVLAVAVNHSRRARGAGHQIVAVAMDELRRWQQSHHPEVTAVFARIHPNNVASRKVFARAGFDLLGTKQGIHEVWVAEVKPDALTPAAH